MNDLENKNQNYYFSFILFFLIILIISVTVYYLYFVNLDLNIKIIGVFILLFESYIMFYLKNKLTQKSIDTYAIAKIRKIVLVVKDEESDKEWLCENVNSFLIGKSTDQMNADIDLSDLQCNDYISQQHAVMNYANGYWYIEDLDSKNGVGLKKYDNEYAYKLKPLTSYKLDQGDIIYISKAKLLLR